MCDLFKLSGVVIATEVHWHCGDARQAHVLIGTHAPDATRRRSIPSGLTSLGRNLRALSLPDFPEQDLNEAVERRTLARVVGEQFGGS